MKNQMMAKEGFLCLPKDAVRTNSVMEIEVMDNALKDEGIVQGDRLRVHITSQVRDGDIVWACIDGISTIRVYFSDEQGRAWLLPKNEEYDATLITDEADVYIVGRALEHIKGTLRTPYAECQRLLNRYKIKKHHHTGIQKERVLEVIREIAPQVKNYSQWYAVCRPLMDKGCIPSYGYDTFVSWVHEACPEHSFLPTVYQVRRMVEDSFAKPVAMWNPDKAPVSGKRFKDYLNLAEQVLEMLK